MLGLVFVGAFAFEMYVLSRVHTIWGNHIAEHSCRGYDNLMNKVWDNHNRGVWISRLASCFVHANRKKQRQWKDIRHKYIEGGDDE